MNFNKFTEWPWEVKEDNKFDRPCYHIIANDSFPGAPSYRVLAVLMGGERDGEEKANAHLMASAKDLYEALDSIVENDGFVGNSEMNEARKALKKAKGESNG